MKRFAALLFLLSGCGGPSGVQDAPIECAVDGAAAFERVCTVERTSRDGATVLTIRSPSGSFRRFAETVDGRGVMAADGAEPATVTSLGPDMIEVSIGSDRYRLRTRAR